MTEQEKIEAIKVAILKGQKKAFEDLIDILVCSVNNEGYTNEDCTLSVDNVLEAVNQLIKIYSNRNINLN